MIEYVLISLSSPVTRKKTLLSQNQIKLKYNDDKEGRRISPWQRFPMNDNEKLNAQIFAHARQKKA